MPAATQRRYRSRDGLQLAYREWRPPVDSGSADPFNDPFNDPSKEKTPVLCLPGIARSSLDFVTLAQDLSGTEALSGTETLSGPRRVIAPDYRGRGESACDPDWRRYQPTVYLDDILHLTSLAGLERCVVIGTSMGGLLAMGLAIARPGLVAGVLLNDVGPGIDRRGLARLAAYIGRDHPQPDLAAAVAWLRETLPPLSLTSDAEWRRLAEATFTPTPHWAPPDGPAPDGWLHVHWDPAIARALHRAARGRLPDLMPLFRALRRVPTLLIRGGLSDVLSAELLETMRREHPAMRVVEVPGVGHAPTLSEPPVRRALQAWLAEIDAPGGQ